MSSPRKESASCHDLEFWMTKLPVSLRNMPVIHLAIPGSHDSMTFDISSRSPIAPDSEQFLQHLKCLGPLLGYTVAKWAKTQDFDAVDQLKNGIRYFDLRISTKIGTDELYFVHGMYAEEVSAVLENIRLFLDTHPKEVIILDFQHFFEFNAPDHENLMNLINEVFSTMLLHYSNNMEHITLEYLTTRFKYQVMAIYRSDAARFGRPYLWPSVCFPTPWPNTVSTRTLIDKLNNNLKKRNLNFGLISQFVLTPSSWFVLRNITRSLKSTCALPLQKQKLQWISKQLPGNGGLNIVISDFVELSACQFAKTVVALNFKLVTDMKPQNCEPLTPVDDGLNY